MRPLDTANKCLVTAHKGHVVATNLRGTMTAAEALELAAWLIVAAELADPEVDGGALCMNLVAEIEHT